MPDHLFTIAAIIFAASYIKGFSGFGFAIFAVPLLSMVIPVHQTVPLIAFVSLMCGSYLVWVNKKSIDFPTAKYLIIGGILTTPLGIIALRSMDENTAQLVLGVAVIATVVGQVILRGSVLGAPRPWKATLTGSLSGVLGGAFGESGPPIVTYLHLTSPPKLALATLHFTFAILQAATLIGHFIHGAASMDTFRTGLPVLPAAVIGAWLGGKTVDKVDAACFRRVVTWMLVGLGVYLIVK